MKLTDTQVRTALRYIQDLPEDFPNFVIPHPDAGVDWPQTLYDSVDAENMANMRAALEAALKDIHVIDEEP